MILPLRLCGTDVDELDLARRDRRAEPLAREAEQLAAQLLARLDVRASSDTNALTISPATGSGLPITPASATAGCSSSTLSTSNGPIRCPADLITSSPRPTNQK